MLKRDGVQSDFLGESRQYLQEQGRFAITFAFALAFIFLVLAAQFESIRDPLLILTTVPLAAFGALSAMFFGFGTLNIYTQIGLVTLVGLIAKHGILIVEFANAQQRSTGAARVRCRPHENTPHSDDHRSHGWRVAAPDVCQWRGSRQPAGNRHRAGDGLLIGTMFTLFVLPAIYARFVANLRRRL